MKRLLFFSTIFLLAAVFLTASVFAETHRKPVSPSFEQLGLGSPASARVALSAPREVLGATLNVPSEYPTIADAVTAANPGDVIVVAAGTYSTAAQIVINHDLTITGAGSGSTTITTTFNTTNSGDDKGWFLVTAGTFNLSGVTLDGAGHLVFQGIRNNGSGGTVNDVVFKNIKYNESGTDYAGTGYVAFGTGPVNIMNSAFSEIGRVGVLYYGSGVNGSSFTGNTCTGKGDGDWLDYCVECGAGAVVTIDACTMSGCTGVASVDGSTSAGILVTTYFGAGTGATITHCVITGNSTGIGVGYDGADASAVVAHDNNLSGNEYGTWTTAPTVDASGNWWGSNVPATVAGLIDGSVDYTPWLNVGTDASGDPGFQGDYSVLDVTAGGAQSGSVGRIQEAIDLVSGSTVNVAPGLYDERITVDKAITLNGATAGVSKKGFVVPPAYAYDPLEQSIIRPSVDADRAVVHIAADNVVFDGFVVANEACAAGSVYRDLVAVDQSLAAPVGIQVLNNVLGPNTNTASQDGTMGRCGFTVYGPHTAGPVKVIVRDNKIFDSKGSGCGIMIVGPYGPSYHGGVSYPNLFSGSVIENNEITGNHRSGIELAGGAQGGSAPADYILIKDNLVTANGWFSTADKDNLKYGNGIMFIRGGSDKANCDAAGSRYISLVGNEVSGNEKNGIYIGPMNKDLLFDANVVQGNGLGTGGYSFFDGVRVDLAESYYPSGTCANYAYLTNIPFSNGTIAGNGDYGYRVIETPALGPTDARNNWWGVQSGPYHATLNPTGTGNDVSDNVLFEPWTGLYTVNMAPAFTLTNCSTPKTVTFHIDRTGTTTDEVRGYEVKFAVDNAKVTAGSFVEGTYLSSVAGPGNTQFLYHDDTGGAYTASCVVLGGDHGGGASGDLFSMTLTPVAAGTSDIAITSLKVRDLNNVPLTAHGTNGSIRIDCTSPTMEAISEAQNGWYNHAPTFANFGFDDDLNLDRADYQIDALGWNAIFTGIDAAFWDSDGWELPGFAGLEEGTHTVYFRVKDDAGNWNTESYSWQFYKDTVPPAAPTNFVAMPGNDKTHLTWTNPTGDATFVGVEIRYNAWGDYPEYGTPGLSEPTYPADHTQGTFVALVDSARYNDGRTPRDIYYYSAFSKDLAGNYSTLGTTAKDRTTSYWLGDIVANGLVDFNDLVPFSSAFGSVSSGGGWDNRCDFGPTDDWSRFGIPLPDNAIDFEDLMIFSMNYGRVTAAGLGDLAIARATEDLGDLVRVELVPGSDGVISVVLKNQATTLKGIHVVVKATGDVVRISRGSLLVERSDIFFGTLPGDGSKADICIAALGTDAALLSKATGEIARIEVTQGSTPVSVRVEKADVRNLDNGKTELVATGGYEAPYVPKATSLMQNYPNPFNPTTTVTFDVSFAGNVTIKVFDVSGRLVATLCNGRKDVGRYHVAWDGKDARGSTMPSGMYFCRMTAPGFNATMKMILVR